MDPNRNKREEKENSPERINLNDYDRDEQIRPFREQADRSIDNVNRNLNEQMGDTDDTVTGEPNHI